MCSEHLESFGFQQTFLGAREGFHDEAQKDAKNIFGWEGVFRKIDNTFAALRGHGRLEAKLGIKGLPSLVFNNPLRRFLNNTFSAICVYKLCKVHSRPSNFRGQVSGSAATPAIKMNMKMLLL